MTYLFVFLRTRLARQKKIFFFLHLITYLLIDVKNNYDCLDVNNIN